MQGWHSQRIHGNGEISDPIIKVDLNLKALAAGTKVFSTILIQAFLYGSVL